MTYYKNIINGDIISELDYYRLSSDAKVLYTVYQNPFIFYS